MAASGEARKMENGTHLKPKGRVQKRKRFKKTEARSSSPSSSSQAARGQERKLENGTKPKRKRGGASKKRTKKVEASSTSSSVVGNSHPSGEADRVGVGEERKMENVKKRKPKRRGGRRKPKPINKVEAISTSPIAVDNNLPSGEADGVVQDGSCKRKRKDAKKEVRCEELTNDDSSRLSGNGDIVNSKNKQRRMDGAKPQGSSKSSTFLEKMKSKLAGGHFRMINETLYTCSGNEALKYFNKDPMLFDAYHAGYQEQMSHWPEQPVNVIIKWLKDHKPCLTVADFGCGNAHLSKSVANKVFSIDLVSSDPSVIACDMANTPIESSSVDVAVFCLSLMGTSYPSYLQEACRVLKPRGWLLIAEVKSRFDPNNSGADPTKFEKAICDLGFTFKSKDISNKMFILWHFKKKEKQETESKEIEWPQLKACIYKRR